MNAGKAEAEILLYPGKAFRIVDQLLTNFHLPGSSLLAMVAAFAGRDNILRAYAHAVEAEYRFLQLWGLHADPVEGSRRLGYVQRARGSYSSSELLATFRTARKASCGISTFPTRFMRFLPSFCFSSSLRLREISPP